MAGKAGAIRAGRAFVEAYLDSSQLEKSLGSMKDKLDAFSRKLGAVGGTLAGAGAAILAPMAAAVKTFANAGTELRKLNRQTGESVQDLSALKFAAASTSVEFEDLVGAAEELNIRLGEASREGTGPLQETFQKMGLDAKEMIKLPLPEKLKQIGEALNSLPDAATKQFAADEIFGGDAFKILPLLDRGAAGIDELTARAAELGLVMSDETANQAEQLDQSLGQLERGVKALVVTVGSALMPEARNFSEFLNETIPEIREWLGENREMIVNLAKLGATLAVVGVGLIATATMISAVSTVVGTAQAGVKLLSGNMAMLGKASLAAFAIAGIVLFAKEIYNANQAVQDLNRNLEKSSELDGALSKRKSEKQASTLEKANSLEGDERDAFLTDEIGMAEKNLAGMQSSLAGQKKLLNEMSPTWRSLWQAGRAEFKVEKQELDAINKRIKQQKEFVDDLRKAKAEQQQELERNSGRTDEELKGIESILGSLNEELETFGLDAGEKAVKQLEQLNANEKELAQARAALSEIEQKKAAEAQQKKEKENASKVAETLESLWQDLADLDLSPVEKAVEDQMRALEDLGATPEQLALAEDLVRQKEQQLSSGSDPGYQANNALEVGSSGALNAYLQATQGSGNTEQQTADNTAEIAKLQKELLRLQKKESKGSEVVFGRPA